MVTPNDNLLTLPDKTNTREIHGFSSNSTTTETRTFRSNTPNTGNILPKSELSVGHVNYVFSTSPFVTTFIFRTQSFSLSNNQCNHSYRSANPFRNLCSDRRNLLIRYQICQLHPLQYHLHNRS